MLVLILQSDLYFHEFSSHWGCWGSWTGQEMGAEPRVNCSSFSSLVRVQAVDWPQIVVYHCWIYGPWLLLWVWEASALTLWISHLKKIKEENLGFNSSCISMLTWIGSSKTACFDMKVRIRVFKKILQTGLFNPIREISVTLASKLLVFTTSVQNFLSSYIFLCI